MILCVLKKINSLLNYECSKSCFLGGNGQFNGKSGQSIFAVCPDGSAMQEDGRYHKITVDLNLEG